MNAVARIALCMLGAANAAAVSGCAAGRSTAAGVTESPRAASDDCLYAVTLRDWRPLDDRNLLLFANGRRAYHVELTRAAFGLTFDVMIGVYDRDGMICPFGGDAIVVDGQMPDRITIASIKRLSDDELDAVYVRYGIRAPAVIEATEVEAPQSDNGTR